MNPEIQNSKSETDPSSAKRFRIGNAAPGLLALGGLLTGCVVGPHYQRPSALGTNAMPAAFAGTTHTNLGVWQPAKPSASLPRGAWWEMFHDAELNRLEKLGSWGNQELAGAVARFNQARALVNVARADLLPQVSADPSFARQRTSGSQISRNGAHGVSSTYSTFSLPLDASWEIDFWGRVRHGIESATASLTAAADDVASAQLAIQAEIAIDYFTLRSLDAEVKLLEETVQTDQRSLDLTRNRRQGGIATDYDVSLAETQLKSTEAQLPEVDLQRANLRHALATLCGQPASTFTVAPAGGAKAVMPAVPVSVPSQLLERRPDIAAAERRMAAANANVGLAMTAFYPSVVLNGLAGLQSIDAGLLFTGASRVWSVGPSLQIPIFTGGRNRAQLKAARAAYDATVADYRQTVLSAFQEVEDQLAAQRRLATELAAESAALESARRTLEISANRYKGGVITYLEVAIAQSTALAHEQTVVQLTARRLTATVSLVKALGAGWYAEIEGETALGPKPPAPGKPGR